MKTIGVIGYQFKQSDYDSLIPSPIREAPYSLSFLAVFDKDYQSIFNMTEDSISKDVFDEEVFPKIKEDLEMSTKSILVDPDK